MRGLYFFVLFVPILGILETGNGLCNLGRSHRKDVHLSSTYTYKYLTADKALDGEFNDLSQCASTDHLQKQHPAWWQVSLSSVSRIYKLNIIFRENNTRHSDVRLFINIGNKIASDLDFSASMYHEEDPYPSSQNVIMYPGGYMGEQVFLYLEKPNDNGNILDICELEIIGCTENQTTIACQCPTEVDGLPDEVLETRIAFPQWNQITLQSHSHYIIMQSSSVYLAKCDFERTCKENTTEGNVSYICLEVCRDDFYNESTTFLVNANNRKHYYLKNDTVILKCNYRHKLLEGHLTRTCLGNLTWTGEKPVCQKCRCPCKRLKSQNFITDDKVLKKRLEQTKKELEVNKTELSSMIRKLTSATDSRMSSKGIGMALGVGILTTVVCLIVCSDLPLMYRQIVHGPYAH